MLLVVRVAKDLLVRAKILRLGREEQDKGAHSAGGRATAPQGVDWRAPIPKRKHARHAHSRGLCFCDNRNRNRNQNSSSTCLEVVRPEPLEDNIFLSADIFCALNHFVGNVERDTDDPPGIRHDQVPGLHAKLAHRDRNVKGLDHEAACTHEASLG